MTDEQAVNEYNVMDDDTFRTMVHDFYVENYPDELRFSPHRMHWDEIGDWYLILSKKGWLTPAWPAEYGGMGLDANKLLIFMDVGESYGVGRTPDMGITMVGPLLIQHGSQEQKDHYLPKILAGEYIWCQGYSEPGSGSDLASLQTSAVRDGDNYIVNGHKTWTTLAMDANMIFMLVRTNKDGKKQEGITFLLIPLDTPGITVRPIINLAMHDEFAEVFFDDVKVPVVNVVGGENNGWTIAKALLGHERIFIGSPKFAILAMSRLKSMAKSVSLFDDPLFVERYTRLQLDIEDLFASYKRFVEVLKRGGSIGPEVSMLKIWNTETQQRVTELMMEAASENGGIQDGIETGDGLVRPAGEVIASRPTTIYGGSNEVQRNILAKAVLRLPT
ncbi:MAG: acyl-CoA dehydrogenase family protein [Porticoccaceae bacterium]|nr:acyl-CoA dehydrogenase family protein [Porticoccaceae bacterium]